MTNQIQSENVKLYPWQLANGESKPEFTLKLKNTLSDGTKSLNLSEPSIKVVRKATRVLEFEIVNGERQPTADAGFAFGLALISGVTGLSEDILEELKTADFSQAQSYLNSFQ